MGMLLRIVCLNTQRFMKIREFYFLLFLLLSQCVLGQEENLYETLRNNQAEDRICFALYTVHENTLKLTAQFYPIKNFEPFEATLEIKEDNQWKEIAHSTIIYPGYTAPFRVEKWDDTKEVSYRVVHNKVAFYEGTITKNPIHKDEFVMAAFSCNSPYEKHGGGSSKKDIVDNIKKIKPDLLFFAGDQVYDHSEHYLHWLRFGREFGEVIRNIPTICLTDDHDVGQANIWGANGVKATARHGVSGGYYMPVSYIQEVERAQTSHLPDPYDPTPIERGIGVYYTSMTWGGISFAILEDRKFKSGLEGFIEHKGEIYEAITDPKVDMRKFDVKGTVLLGERQLKFLEDWTTDWNNAEMKSVLSQTIFAMANNYSGEKGRELYGDFDTNGWPQNGRNKALYIMRKSYACHIAGDQHLGTVLQHGIEEWNDASYSFCVPAIANLWLRWWQPNGIGKNKKKGAPAYTGEYLDGFQNKITMHATANPSIFKNMEGGEKLTTRAAGFGVVKFNKSKRSITFECWARDVDITSKSAKQYNGWPITIQQADNFKIKKGYKLPTLEISKENQVVTIHNEETQEVVSSIRVNGKTFQPKVLTKGLYSIEIGEGENKKFIPRIRAKKRNVNRIQVDF